MEPVAVHPHVRAEAGVSPTVIGELVPELQHRPGQRAGGRRWLLALWYAGRNTRPGTVVLPDYRVRRRTARRHGSPATVAREGSDDAAELDRAVGRRAGEICGRRRSIDADRSIHHAAGHDLWRDVRDARPGAPA